MHRFVHHVKTARQVQPGLFDRLDTSQQIHRCLLICLASRVGHAGRMLLSSAICRLLCLLLCLCNMSLQPGRYSLVSLTDLTSQQIHRCLLICLASRVGHAGRMLLSSAICRLLCLLLCAQGLCNMSLQPGRYSLVSLTDLTHPNRCTDVYWYALNLVQVIKSHAAVCCYLQVVVLLQHAQGLCNMSTQAVARSASPIQHINNRAREACC
jgi:hypothetical protein